MIDFELFAGYSGFCSHVGFRLFHAMGGYRGLRDVDLSSVRRLAFVCKGNICRSPYAMARAHALGFPTVSFGLDTTPGVPADAKAEHNARARGLDLSGHRAAVISMGEIRDDDLIVVFEPRHLNAVRRICGGQSKVTLLGIWSTRVRPKIHDPYGRSDRYFQECFASIDANLAGLVKRLAKVSPEFSPTGLTASNISGAPHG